jgi:hypothetical protein
VPIEKQVDTLLEVVSSIHGWWPAPNSNLGRPRSDQFWEEVLGSILVKKKKNQNPDKILSTVSRTWGIKPKLLEEFLKQSGLYGAFTGGTLDKNTCKKVIDSAITGSGIWAAGTKLKVVGKHHFEKSWGSSSPVSAPDNKKTKFSNEYKNPYGRRGRRPDL